MKTLCRTTLLASLLIAGTAVLTLSQAALSQDAAASDAVVPLEDPGPPEWFVNHLKTMTENNGRWIANNAAHRSDNEPFDAYGMSWRWGLGKKSATSRLFVVRGGEDMGTLWEHRTAWHPGKKKAMTYAFGSDGSFGVGTLEPVSDTEIKVEEEFFELDGSSYRVGHRVIDLGGGQVKMQSFGITPDGTWEPRRSYVWKLDGVATNEEDGEASGSSSEGAKAEQAGGGEDPKP